MLGSTAHAQTHASAQDSNLGFRIHDSSQDILTKRIFVAALVQSNIFVSRVLHFSAFIIIVIINPSVGGGLWQSVCVCMCVCVSVPS